MAALCLGSFVFTSCDPDDNKTPDSLTFSVAKAEVEVGKTVEVTVKNGTQPFTVKSSDEKLATVSDRCRDWSSHNLCCRQQQGIGSFTVEVKAAATTVTVTDKDGKTGEISVKVE